MAPADGLTWKLKCSIFLGGLATLLQFCSDISNKHDAIQPFNAIHSKGRISGPSNSPLPCRFLVRIMTLPETHPPTHQHKGLSCPVTGKTHQYCPPQPGDSRSPCPALNTMANHGYIARDGKNLSVFDIIRGLKACYGLSTPLAAFLSIVGFMILRKIGRLDLFRIGKHGQVEHNASLVHYDTPRGQVFAPIEIHQDLVDQLIDDVKTGADDPEATDARKLMNATDVAIARVRREKQSPTLDGVHAEIARGEMAIILGVWEQKGQGKVGIPVEWMRDWIGHERLPEGWMPDHVQGFFDVVNRSKSIREAMISLRDAETEAKTIADQTSAKV